MRPFIFSYLALIVNFILFSNVSAFEIEREEFFRSQFSGPELRVLSTTDLEDFLPLINGFQNLNPNISLRYSLASSSELYNAIATENASFDLAISSAMDLQVKLSNDGFVQSHRSSLTTSLPTWARWRDELFAFTQEPAALIIAPHAFKGMNQPSTRQDLIRLLRENPDKFRGRIGTYDVRKSGAGYLFATQDARQSDTFWRLSEVMGGLETKLYCCSSEMIKDLLSGKIDIAYNVVGSYAAARLKDQSAGQLIKLSDFTNVMLRSALIPKNSENPDLGARFIDFLLSSEGRKLMAEQTSLPPINEAEFNEFQYLKPIKLGPGLLVFLDRSKRRSFMREWSAALLR